MTSLIPAQFKTTITDRFISSFFAGKGDVMIQAELMFGGNLDVEVLRKAFRMVLDAEPVLGCKLSIVNDIPVWKRIVTSEVENFRSFSNEDDYNIYLNTTIDIQQGPALQGAHLGTPHGDRLLFKVAHEVTDAAGVKEIIAIVAFLYRQIKRSPGFSAVPNVTTYRSARQLARWIPKRAALRIWWNAVREVLPLVVRRTACNPMLTTCSVDKRKYHVKTLGCDMTLAIRDAGKKYGATINDMILAAFLRVLHRTSKVDNGYLRCGISIDLKRWYLPGGKADTIANLSSVELFDIGKNPGSTFGETVRKVVAFTSGRKKNWIGLNMHTGFLNLLRGWPYSKLKSYFAKRQLVDMKEHAVFPLVTNLGEIDKKRLLFDAAPHAAHLIVPAAFPPYFGIGISGFDGTLTITTVVFPDTEVIIGNFIDKLIEELDSCS